MTTLNATARLYNLIDEATETYQPIVITGRAGMQFFFLKKTGTR